MICPSSLQDANEQGERWGPGKQNPLSERWGDERAEIAEERKGERRDRGEQ